MGIRWRGLPAWLLARHLPPGDDAGLKRKLRLLVDWNVQLLFGRDGSELGKLGHPPSLAEVQRRRRASGARGGNGSEARGRCGPARRGAEHVCRPAYDGGQMPVTDIVKQDLVTAMKAGEKDRVGTLRLLLSELQKDAKEGTGDELAVLRRERKRRARGRDGVPRRRARRSSRTARRPRRQLIEAYLPAELSDEELRVIVGEAVAETRRDLTEGHGQVMKTTMARVAGRADGKRVSGLVQEALRG